jgi:hypothetical protein
VRDLRWPPDEYDSYARHLVSLVAQGASAHDLAKHLEKLRTTAIGLRPDPERDAATAAEIIEALLADERSFKSMKHATGR